MGKTIYLFDLDDTLIISGARTSAQFDDPDMLRNAKVTTVMTREFAELYENGEDIAILTARDNPEIIRQYFRDTGYDLPEKFVITVSDKSWWRRFGHGFMPEGFDPVKDGAENKRTAIITLHEIYGYTDFVFYDDKVKNLAAAKNLEAEIPGISVDVKLVVIPKNEAMSQFVPTFEEFGYNHDPIQQIYSSNKTLQQIGTLDEYRQYVSSIFPQSKIKDVLWHGTDSKFETYNKYMQGANFNFSTGIHFDRDAGKAGYWGKYVMPAVIDTREIFTVRDHDDLEFARDRYRTGRMLSVFRDTVVSDFKTETGGQYVSVAKPEQVHFLGTNNDVEMFRHFVAQNLK